MLFKKIFVEKEIANRPKVVEILSHFPKTPVYQIDKISDVFDKVHKPYLQKRDTLNLFVGTKKGQLVKPSPDAYGVAGDPHYYFVHAYNCIYECEYCYLQGYFSSPDLVIFINYDEMASAIRQTVAQHSPDTTVWFHAGEFSDSLALSHITNEWEIFWDTFAELPNARLELRTKSVNIKAIEHLPPLGNIVVSFSLSPEVVARKYDRKTPSVTARLKALKQLADKGFVIGIHLDPIVYTNTLQADYDALMQSTLAVVPEEQIAYISVGVMRFSKESFRAFSENYPNSDLLAAELVKGLDGKVRYNRPMRMYILKTIQNICIRAGIAPEKIYFCMETQNETNLLNLSDTINQ
jgi:spore photoproduct lyase